MRILGLETSCDDTSAAVVENGRLRSNIVSSQTALHRPYRGVVPELAARAHLDNLMPAVARALKDAGPGKLDAVAYTRGPGLMGPLLIGKVAAQTLARLLKVPAVGVNHLEGHVLAAELEGGRCRRQFSPSQTANSARVRQIRAGLPGRLPPDRTDPTATG